MRFASVLATAAIVVTCGSGAIQAQSSQTAVPAEFPPASYSGRQYVDSEGCVFIRAGIDGAVTWVPRMSRSRKQICGFRPSLSGTALAKVAAPRVAAPVTAPAPAPAPAPTKVATVRRAPAPAPSPAPSAVRKSAYQSAPAPAPAVPAKAAAPAKSVAPAPAKAAAATPTPGPRRVVAKSCNGLSPLSRQYLDHDRYRVRCGPQTAPHVTVRAKAGPNATYYRLARVPRANTVAVPTTGDVYHAGAQVYAGQATSTRGIHVPAGYAPIWDDDRLNPQRGHQTAAGQAQMDLIWTRTVPRELIVRDTGQVVTRSYPGLVYPYTSYAQQEAAEATAKATISTRGKAPATAAPATRSQPVAASASAERAADTRAASHRYVQLGAFTDPANAKGVAQLVANSGLPARMGKIKLKGESLTLVLAGPFATQAQLDNGLQRVRGLGYVQAVLRK